MDSSVRFQVDAAFHLGTPKKISALQLQIRGSLCCIVMALAVPVGMINQTWIKEDEHKIGMTALNGHLGFNFYILWKS